VAKKAEIEKNMAYLGVKTTAKPRHTTYISTDTGIFLFIYLFIYRNFIHFIIRLI
jgi:hypothetical protein